MNTFQYPNLFRSWFSVSVISSLVLINLLLISCSSTPKREKEAEQHTTLSRDYEVRDASDNARPTWVNDANEWAKDQKEFEGFRLFSFETTPKVDRETACDLAKTNARSDIASEIATYIEKSLGNSREGQAAIDPNNPDTRPLREFIEVTLAEKTKALVHGASVVKTYWEKRQYLQNKGAKRDYVGFTCAALIKIERDRLKRSVEEAANHVVQKVDDPSTRENVKKALKDVAENFDKAKQGL